MNKNMDNSESAQQVAPFRSPADRSLHTDRVIKFILLLLLCLIYLPYIGSFGLWDPWETHYGEVGRQMLERGDWVSTWWGSHWRDESGVAEGRYFFSKPILLMWMMGIGMEVFGISELGIRIGVGLIAISASFAIFLMIREIFNRRAGIICALVVTTSPFWTMLGRQSQTDMPYVGLMTIGLCFLMMSFFGKRRDEQATRMDCVLILGFWLLVFIPQMQLIWVKLGGLQNDLPFFLRYARYGPVLVALYSLAVLGVLISILRMKDRRRRHLHALTFYLFVALATLAKGILGFALPGLIILVYLIVTYEWRLLKQAELIRGILLFITVCFPWYATMFIRHGNEYYQRFIVHDHLRRLSSGVHQTDNGSFEHFIKWLGYGLFPWGSFIPAALAQIPFGKQVGNRTDAQRARLFLLLWFVLSFTLFTLSSTKFHHYIFPCVPALGILIGLYLDDLLRGKTRHSLALYAVVVTLFVLVGFDLIAEPQNLKNLFTYQYDRMWHASLSSGFSNTIKVFFVVGLIGLLLLSINRKKIRVGALSILLCSSTAMAAWSVDVYMPRMAVDWSQGYLWNTYYTLCTPIDPPAGAPEFKPYCAEPVIAFKLNWRGETYYTHNEVIPVEDDADFNFFIEQNDGRSFYSIMQRGRISNFRSSLPANLRPGVSEVHNENLKFILVRVLNAADREALERRLGPLEENED